MIAALYVETNGIYYGLPDVDPWDKERDARKYAGPHPVVAHPPCNLWVNLAAVNWKRYGRQRPAWYPGGDDGGCFAAAIEAIERYGGVIEHPAYSHAWDVLRLPKPSAVGWRYADGFYVCEVWQSAYGHRARKRTWVLYCGDAQPPELDWTRRPGDAQCGWFDRIKPTVGKREASATPEAFRDALLDIARAVAD